MIDPIPKFIIHLLSGGLDSVTMLYDLVGQGHQVHALLFDYQQRHVQELTFAKGHCHRMGIQFTTIDLPDLGGMKGEVDGWIVPNRNMIFLAIAVNVALKAGADTVTIGCNADDEAGFPDCRMAFIQAMNTTLITAENGRVEICAPYLNMHKWQIAAMAQSMGVPTNDIWTCYRGGVKPCGTCPACVKLNQAFVLR